MSFMVSELPQPLKMFKEQSKKNIVKADSCLRKRRGRMNNRESNAEPGKKQARAVFK